MTTFPLALDGIRVLDLSRVIAGPWCGALLGDFGADVIKVEDTGAGDESRTWPPHKDGETAAYLLFNRNKRGMTLDLKSPEGVEVIKALVAKSDVLVENFRTGTMESFGLGYDVLADINPRLIYCSVSAFGRTGPRKDSPGYEALMQAFSGIMSITGEPGGPPVRSAVSFLDLTTGILCALGVTAAVLPARAHRARPARRWLAAGYRRRAPRLPRGGLSARRPGPDRRSAPGTRRCRPIATSGAGTGSGSSLPPPMTGSGGSSPRPRPAAMAADPRFTKNGDRVANRAELEAMLEKIIGDYDREPLLKRLEEADVPATPVNTVDQVMNDPQTIARGMIERVVHPTLGEIPVVGTPLKFSRMNPGVRRAAPAARRAHRRGPRRVRALTRAHPRAARQEGHSLTEDHTMFRRRKNSIPSAQEALPGRATRLPVPEQHFVNAARLEPPFPDGMELGLFGLGCFWGAERKFWEAKGVYSTSVGYAGGSTPNPTYEEVCSGATGHTEVVRVVFDPRVISYGDILKIFWENHDPTQGMRQGNDVGTQYRSAIYCYGPAQLAAAQASRAPTSRCSPRPATGRSPRRSARRPSSTTRRTITSIPREEPVGLLWDRRHGCELPVGPGVGRSQPVILAVALCLPLASDRGRARSRESRTEGVTLLDRLRALYPEASRRSHKQWIEGGRITVNGLVARDARASVARRGSRGATGHSPPRISRAGPSPRSG